MGPVDLSRAGIGGRRPRSSPCLTVPRIGPMTGRLSYNRAGFRGNAEVEPEE